jgi:hypothetical protein
MFQRVNEFKYIGVLVTENSEIKSEIKIRIAAGNRCCHVFIRSLKCTVVSSKTKWTIYEIVIRSVVTYGSEV